MRKNRLVITAVLILLAVALYAASHRKPTPVHTDAPDQHEMSPATRQSGVSSPGRTSTHNSSAQAMPSSSGTDGARAATPTKQTGAQTPAASSNPLRLAADTDPAQLTQAVLKYEGSKTRQSVAQAALGQLCSLSGKGYSEATQQLITLARKLDDNQLLHQTLQSLGQIGDPKANQALFTALEQNLSNPRETTRIASYFSTSQTGTLQESVVDQLLNFAVDPAINSASRSALVKTVYHKGGAYGREQLRQQLQSGALPGDALRPSS